MMKEQKCNLKNFLSKEWWKEEFKSINWTDVLILLAFILLYLHVRQVQEVVNDPCSFCFINNFNGVEKQTCREYINLRVKLNLDEVIPNGKFTNLSRPNS